MNKESYQFSNLDNKEKELERLKEQAKLIKQKETSLLISHGLKPNMKVLDAACGPGVISSYIADYVTSGIVVGIDINQELLNHADKEYSGLYNNLTFANEDLYHLPYENEFDFIYCRLLFQHLSNPHLALKSLYKALKPNGILCINDIDDGLFQLTPSHPSFEYIKNESINYQSSLGGDRFVGRKLNQYLLDNNFRDIEQNIMTVKSEEIGLENFFHITMTFRVQCLLKNGDVTAEHHMEELNNLKDLSGVVSTYLISGKK